MRAAECHRPHRFMENRDGDRCLKMEKDLQKGIRILHQSAPQWAHLLYLCGRSGLVNTKGIISHVHCLLVISKKCNHVREL